MKLIWDKNYHLHIEVLFNILLEPVKEHNKHTNWTTACHTVHVFSEPTTYNFEGSIERDHLVDYSGMWGWLPGM